MTGRIIAVRIVAALLLSSAAVNAQNINTRNPAPGTELHQFGGDSTYFVQTFTTPGAATALTSFSVWIAGSEQATFHARIYEMFGAEQNVYDGFHNSAGGAGPQEISFSFASITVNANAMYALYLNGASEPLGLEAQATDSYSGGSSYYSLNGGALDHDFGADLDFVATFDAETTTPEPNSLALVATGIAVVLSYGARKRNALK